MSSYNNFSLKDRARKDSNFNTNPDNFEVRKVNKKQVKDFQALKPKWRELCSYFRYYPDKFLDFIQPEDAKIKLYFYQRIYLRIMFRYRKVFITATRGTSKSFLQNLAFVLLCIMYPRTKLFCCAPGKEQAARITQECLDDIFEFFPLLKEEVKIFKREKDYTKLVFYNGSKYDVVQMKDSSRGGRRFGGAIEEIGDKKFDGDILNSVVIPLMANSRVAMCGKVDPNEIHKREIYITTASPQQQFAYAKCKEIFNDMMNGDSAFCTGNSYELPCMYGQLDIDFVEEKKESPTYSILDFMREYESIYTGSDSDSLVSDEKLNKCRTLGIAEWEHCGDTKVQYVLAYDVSRSTGRENALSALIVIKLIPRGDGIYHKQVVNIFSMEGQHDTWQAKFLKEKVKEYKASILVIDANGIGSGVVDQLVLDLNDGNPPYKVVNDIDNQWTKYELVDAIPMVFALKSQRKETRNSDMINNVMKVFGKLDIELLKTPNEGIKDLEKKNKKKFKDDSEELAIAEIPYILTNNLCDEIMNLKYKQRGNDSDIEQVSRSIPKDKFSALMYGLFWVHLEEKKNKERKGNSNVDINKLFNFRKPQIRRR
ncbi:MAG TPA: DNA-packaging protein [Gallicola sp.]|nr:DNA-packaging protein [Gallicola sp.]